MIGRGKQGKLLRQGQKMSFLDGEGEGKWKKGVQIALHAFFEDSFRVEGLFGRDGECFPAVSFPKTCASCRIVRR